MEALSKDGLLETICDMVSACVTDLSHELIASGPQHLHESQSHACVILTSGAVMMRAMIPVMCNVLHSLKLLSQFVCLAVLCKACSLMSVKYFTASALESGQHLRFCTTLSCTVSHSCYSSSSMHRQHLFVRQLVHMCRMS